VKFDLVLLLWIGVEPAGRGTPSSSNPPAWPGSGVSGRNTSRISFDPAAAVSLQNSYAILLEEHGLNAAQIDCSGKAPGRACLEWLTPWPPSCPSSPYLLSQRHSQRSSRSEAAAVVIRVQVLTHTRRRCPFRVLLQGGADR